MNNAAPLQPPQATKSKQRTLALSIFFGGIALFCCNPIVFWNATIIHHDRRAIVARREMATWTTEDYEEIWRGANALAASAPETPRPVKRSEMPAPLRKAGFSGRVSNLEFDARRGGSSFGLTAAYVRCRFGADAELVASQGCPDVPGGRWSPPTK